jgi:O-antigen ligase
MGTAPALGQRDAIAWHAGGVVNATQGPIRAALPMLAPMVLLAILPFPHTTALRFACLFIAVATAAYSWRGLGVPRIPCRLPIAFWAVVATASILTAVDFQYTRDEIKAEVVYSLLAFFSFFALTRDESRLRLALLALAAGFAVFALGSIAGYAWRGGWPLGVWNGEPAPMTNYLVMAAPAVSLGAYLWLPRHWKWVVFGIALLAVVIGVLSGQRAIWLAFAVQALIASAWLWRTNLLPSNRLRLGVAAVLVVLVPLGGLLATEHLRTAAQPWAAMEKDLRPLVWKNVAVRIAQTPFTGAGLGRMVLLKAHPDLIPPANNLFWHAHNTVLNYGLSAGVPGMVAIVFLFAAFAWRFWRFATTADPVLRAIGLAGTLMIAGMFTRNMFNDFFVRDGAMLFWTLSGAMLGYALRRERE